MPSQRRELTAVLLVGLAWGCLDAVAALLRAAPTERVWLDLIFAGPALVAFGAPMLAFRSWAHHREGSRGASLGPAVDGAVFATLGFGVEVYAGLNLTMRLAAWVLCFLVVSAVSVRTRGDDRRGRVVALATLTAALVGNLELNWQTKPCLHLAIAWLACTSMVDLLRHRLISLSQARCAVVWGLALAGTCIMWSSSNALRWFITSGTTQQGALVRGLQRLPVLEAPPEPFVASLESRLMSPAGGSTSVPAGPAFDVVFVGVDAWRADHADALHRTRRAIGPHYDFERAVSPAPRTIFTLASMTRGRRVSEIDFDRGVAEGGVPTLAHYLRDAGFDAVFIPSHRYLDETMRIAEGFETLYPHEFERVQEVEGTHRGVVRAAELFESALELSTRRQGPLLLWTHLMEAHHPYRHADGIGPANLIGYAHALDDLDVQLAAFIETFEASRPRPVVWVLFGDHGEAFGERGMHKHSTSLFDDQIRVSAWLRVPGRPGRSVAAPISTSSLASTLAELVEGRVPETMTAPSLLACMDEAGACPDLAVSELPAFGSTLNDLVAYTARERRWIINLGARAMLSR